MESGEWGAEKVDALGRSMRVPGGAMHWQCSETEMYT